MMRRGTPRILVVEDDDSQAALICHSLRSRGWGLERVASGGDAIRAIAAREYGLVVLDVGLPDMDGTAVHRAIAQSRSSPVVVFLTGDEDAERAVAAILAGASNYLVKRPGYLDRVVHAAEQALAIEPPSSAPVRDRAGAVTPGLIGVSDAIATVRSEIEQVAASAAPVLIIGETGTGKELVAREIHQKSLAASGPFVAINSAAIPHALIESELFGAVRGSYTGLSKDKEGLLAASDGGTLFLDEIGELDVAVQAKLLRILETEQFRPLGSIHERRIRVRFVAATNRDLKTLVRLGTFRADLYYRISVLQLTIPPLRERLEDIPMLVDHFLREWNNGGDPPRPSVRALEELSSARWPGNVRELRNVVQRALVRWRGGPIDRFEIDSEDECQHVWRERRGKDLEGLRALLAQHKGRLGPVAEALGVSLRTVQRRVRELGIALRDFR